MEEGKGGGGGLQRGGVSTRTAGPELTMCVCVCAITQCSNSADDNNIHLSVLIITVNILLYYIVDKMNHNMADNIIDDMSRLQRSNKGRHVGCEQPSV